MPSAIKIQYEGEVRRFPASDSEPLGVFEAVTEKIARELSLAKGSFVIKYFDSDEDLISVRTQEEWNEALESLASQVPKFIVHKETTKKPAPQSARSEGSSGCEWDFSGVESFQELCQKLQDPEFVGKVQASVASMAQSFSECAQSAAQSTQPRGGACPFTGGSQASNGTSTPDLSTFFNGLAGFGAQAAASASQASSSSASGPTRQAQDPLQNMNQNFANMAQMAQMASTAAPVMSYFQNLGTTLGGQWQQFQEQAARAAAQPEREMPTSTPQAETHFAQPSPAPTPAPKPDPEPVPQPQPQPQAKPEPKPAEPTNAPIVEEPEDFEYADEFDQARAVGIDVPEMVLKELLLKYKGDLSLTMSELCATPR